MARPTRQAETSPQEHERELNALPQKCKRKVDAPLQGSPNRGKRGRGHKAPRNSERKPGTLPQSERGAPPRREPEMGALREAASGRNHRGKRAC